MVKLIVDGCMVFRKLDTRISNNQYFFKKCTHSHLTYYTSILPYSFQKVLEHLDDHLITFQIQHDDTGSDFGHSFKNRGPLPI